MPGGAPAGPEAVYELVAQAAATNIASTAIARASVMRRILARASPDVDHPVVVVGVDVDVPVDPPPRVTSMASSIGSPR